MLLIGCLHLFHLAECCSSSAERVVCAGNQYAPDKLGATAPIQRLKGEFPRECDVRHLVSTRGCEERQLGAIGMFLNSLWRYGGQGLPVV